MSALPPALDAALAQPRATIFGAIQMELPGHTARLLVGSGFVNFAVDGAVQTFTGLDPLIGVFAAIDTLTDGLGDEAPALTLSFIPASAAAVDDLASEGMQGSGRRRSGEWPGDRRDEPAAVRRPARRGHGQDRHHRPDG